MIGPFTDPQICAGVSRIFGDASRRLWERRNRSLERETLGTPARLETSDTDDLIDDFQSEIGRAVAATKGQLADSGANISIEFHAEDLRGKPESTWGPDFGIRLHMQAGGYVMTKGVLLQCKRLYRDLRTGAFSFDQLRGLGETQAEKMTGVTPASFFLLFNGIDGKTMQSMCHPPGQWTAFMQSHRISQRTWSEFWSDAFAGDPPFEMWNTGISVLPAVRVLAESRANKAAKAQLPIGADHWLRGTIPFGVFMADLFGACFVGDTRESLIEIVTPPALRKPSASSSERALLPVRRLMDMDIRERTN